MDDEGKMTVFVTSGPETPQRCATPFYMANIAAAMDNEAEMIFQIDGVLLMKKGVAEGLVAKEGGKRIIDFIKEAKEAGVEIAEMTQEEFDAWRELAKETSYKAFVEEVPDGQELLDMALAVE